MSHAIFEKSLTTNTSERTISGAISIAIMAVILLLLFFVKISLPDPPLINKKAPLELDFGMVQPPEVNQNSGGSGGGSQETSPKLGGEPSMGPTPTTPAGGPGQIVTNDAEPDATELPPIDPPTSSKPAQENPRFKVDFTKIGKRNGKGGEGDPTGTKTGTGTNPIGSGSGGNGGSGGGNFGGNGSGIGKGKGSGIHQGSLSGHEIQSDLKSIPIAEGYGTIVARIIKTCENCPITMRLSLGGGYNYNGSDGNAMEVLRYYFKPEHTKLVAKSLDGAKYPSSGEIRITIKREF